MKQAPKSSSRIRLPERLSDLRPFVSRLDDLDEITVHLGTFQERLHIAHAHERPQLQVIVSELRAQYERRRAELA